MGFIRTMITFGLGALLGAYTSGKLQCSRNIEGFHLQRQGQEVVLVSDQLEKAYGLTHIRDEAYMGDAQHHYEGFRALANYEMVMGDTAFVGPAETNSGWEGWVRKARDIADIFE